jgi:hypothetical protein
MKSPGFVPIAPVELGHQFQPLAGGGSNMCRQLPDLALDPLGGGFDQVLARHLARSQSRFCDRTSLYEHVFDYAKGIGRKPASVGVSKHFYFVPAQGGSAGPLHQRCLSLCVVLCQLNNSALSLGQGPFCRWAHNPPPQR